MVRYKMLGRDVNSFPIQYRTWVVENQPDLTGSLYTGLKSGTNALVDISATEIQDGYAVVDFSLPDQTSWHMIQKTLPAVACDSQLAIVDGYAYLFGGVNSDIILRADLNNPADWTDTGARLPTTLGSSQLAIIDGYFYLFGGAIERTTTDAIYLAPITDPLAWEDSGATLPSALQNSQLGIADGYLYLFGGYDGSAATDSIWRASVSDPLTWADTGDTLPDAIYGSHIAMINNQFFLFGGTVNGIDAIDNIYSAPLSDPTNFTDVGAMIGRAFFGQFFTFGNDGYLIAPSTSPDQSIFPETKLFRCSLEDPTTWEDFNTIDGLATQSQLAIIYDRPFLFGGNGSTLIFTTDLRLKFSITSGSVSQNYGSITRTQYQATENQLDLIKIIGFPFWKTDYSW